MPRYDGGMFVRGNLLPANQPKLPVAKERAALPKCLGALHRIGKLSRWKPTHMDLRPTGANGAGELNRPAYRMPSR